MLKDAKLVVRAIHTDWALKFEVGECVNYFALSLQIPFSLKSVDFEFEGIVLELWPPALRSSVHVFVESFIVGPTTPKLVYGIAKDRS
jgi:hypothetical protein